jgi:hypothetical protein
MTTILPMVKQGVLLAAIVGLGGCRNAPLAVSPAPTTQNATAIDPAQGEPEYWMNQPATASVDHGDFDRLWDAADEVSRDLLFKIDRQNRRLGLLTTEPNVSAQWFEPWRREVQSPGELAESSAATIRRTITYKFDKQGDGYVVTPKVLIERQAISERRVSGYLAKTYFRGDRDAAGSREADAGVILPDSCWYPTGRDHALETLLAEKIEAKLRG